MAGFADKVLEERVNQQEGGFFQYLENKELSFEDFKEQLDKKIDGILDNIKNLPITDPNYSALHQAGMFYSELQNIFNNAQKKPSFCKIQECGEYFLGKEGGNEALSFVKDLVASVKGYANEQEMIDALNGLKGKYEAAEKVGQNPNAQPHWKNIIVQTKNNLQNGALDAMG